uniref:Uncharacterized protein n=1 Tax=Desulfobacca acetoxidans TaxID=60893 RepID=A0A7V4G6T2_9BACT
MAHMEFFIVSEEVSVDQQTNRLSLFNVIEQIMAADFPFSLLPCVAVSLWVAEQDDYKIDFQCTLRIISPGSENREFPINFKFLSRRHRVIHRIHGVPINEPGLLRFEILLNGQYQACHEVDVGRIDPANLIPPVQDPN